MDFWITIVGLVRRKAVIIPAVVVAAVLGAAAYVNTPVSYVSSSLMVMTTTEYGGSASQDPLNPTPMTNPMLNFNDSLRTSAAILIQAMNTMDAAQQLGIDADTRLVVNDGRTNPDLLGLNGPFLYIVAESSSPEEAQQVVVQAQQLMRDKLLSWQRAVKAPARTYVSMVDVVTPTAPAADGARAKKLAGAAALAGFFLTIGIAYVGSRTRRGRRATATATASAEAGADDAPPPRPRKRSRRQRRRRPEPEAEHPHPDADDSDRPARTPVTAGARKP
ncbi:hypothetical protein GON03_07810 [Nocardioides sp. MAH-18]|uniref:Polysaccharide chain length determinant N-terminal domain-containing protein n=1 Tax=Nocardioides agri TaxID=2682843 RepID=A0A6L6XP90_9ACTN|nr:MULTISPECIES: hypothetical protein [unclassified Nocardioides]MBA2954223.1 hypothetical protein [Nocardioides sp. CGMCC 1.13656]MVQ49084.1 hypothetical protein [Nocardioides sp. MAH-18]